MTTADGSPESQQADKPTVLQKLFEGGPVPFALPEVEHIEFLGQACTAIPHRDSAISIGTFDTEDIAPSRSTMPSATEGLSIQSLGAAREASTKKEPLAVQEPNSIFSNPDPFVEEPKPSTGKPADAVSEEVDEVAPEDVSDDGSTPRASIDGILGVDGASSLHRPNLQTPKLSPGPYTRSPMTMTRSVSVAGSVHSFKSIDGPEEEWSPERLLELTDTVREALGQLTLPQDDLAAFLELLGAIVEDEQSGEASKMIKLSDILYSRFDKLLEEIHNIEDAGKMVDNTQFKDVFGMAGTLENMWQQRFKEEYFSLDVQRNKDMRINALRDMILDPGDRNSGSVWLVKNRKTSNDSQQGHLTFTPSDWWLDIFCAYRDGIIGTIDSPVTKGPSGPTALAMVTGEEVDGPTLDMYEYTRKGSRKDMLWSLMAHRHPIRVLRGSNLKSKYAPKAGVRYDGLYVVRQFGHKLLNEKENIYRSTLILERLGGQNSIHLINHVPWPSQVDTWNLYDEMIGDDYRSRKGDEDYTKWRQFEEEQEEEKRQFLKSKALQEGFRKYTLVPRKESYKTETANDE